ncbi:MAG TPA: hypothetical protein PK156_33725 [Polyangium sp.]|nr:hypothetical protein [Polyangium sp.]
MKNNKHPTIAHINPDSPRAKVWREVLGEESMPIRSPISTPVLIDDVGVRDAYFLDVGHLDATQHERLVAHLSNTFLIPLDEVRSRLAKEKYIPILAEDVGVISESLWFI